MLPIFRLELLLIMLKWFIEKLVLSVNFYKKIVTSFCYTVFNCGCFITKELKNYHVTSTIKVLKKSSYDNNP